MTDEPTTTAALCQERPFATWRAAMREPGATDYRLCTQHGAWHVVTDSTPATAAPLRCVHCEDGFCDDCATAIEGVS